MSPQAHGARLLVPAHGVVNLVVAALTYRHQHFVFSWLYGVLSVCMWAALTQIKLWRPEPWDVMWLSVGLGLALGIAVSEWLTWW